MFSMVVVSVVVVGVAVVVIGMFLLLLSAHCLAEAEARGGLFDFA